MPYLDNLAKLELQQGDNDFADYYKDLMNANYSLVYRIGDVAISTKRTYYNNTDWQRDLKYINTLMQQSSTLSNQMDLRVRAFTKKKWHYITRCSCSKVYTRCKYKKIVEILQ
ncbi:MAG: hypothetical protein V9E96_10990 [Chitinophagaceae bacterium]